MPDTKDNKQSRIEALRNAGIDVRMPECEAMYLVGYLYEVGPVMAGGMGEVPLSHTELRSWQDNTGIELESWEVRAMSRLSKEYLSESNKATKHDAPAPWPEGDYSKVLAAIKLRAYMDALDKL